MVYGFVFLLNDLDSSVSESNGDHDIDRTSAELHGSVPPNQKVFCSPSIN